MNMPTPKKATEGKKNKLFSWTEGNLPMNKGGKFLKKLWCRGGRVQQVI